MPGPGTWSAGDILTASDLNAIGVWTAYTPTLEQDGVRTATINYAEYCQINQLVFCNVDLTCTTTGSAGNAVIVTLPVNGAAANSGVGSGQFFDSSGTDVRLLTSLSGTTNVQFFADDSNGSRLGVSPSVALGNNDVISFSIVYRSA
jgi:hypothetical protein